VAVDPIDMMNTGSSYDRFLSIRTFGPLDGLRALSVIAVIWQHTSGRPGPEFFEKGYFGVDLFFAISGFLITTLLLRERRRNGHFSLPKFYIRRVFRIFPIYYLVLGVYVVLVLLTQRTTVTGQRFMDHLPWFATYTSNWVLGKTNGESVTFYFAWSLATEEQFYLFWPPLLALLLFLPGNRLVKPLAAIGILVVGSQLALATQPSFATAAERPMVILSSLALPILLGAALALVLDNRRGFERLAPALSHPASAPTLAGLILASLIVTTPEQLTQALMVLFVGALCLREKTLLHRPLMWAPLAYVGKVSYGIYLMHMLCANVVRRVIHEQVGIPLFALTVPVAVAVAGLSYRLVERPLLKLGHRWGSPGADHGQPGQQPVLVGPRVPPDPAVATDAHQSVASTEPLPRERP